jgi:hypothetical protein
MKIPCAAIVGSFADDVADAPFAHIYSTQTSDMSPQQSMHKARELISQRAAQAAREMQQTG